MGPVESRAVDVLYIGDMPSSSRKLGFNLQQRIIRHVDRGEPHSLEQLDSSSGHELVGLVEESETNSLDGVCLVEQALPRALCLHRNQ